MSDRSRRSCLIFQPNSMKNSEVFQFKWIWDELCIVRWTGHCWWKWEILVSRCIVQWNGIYETTEGISTKSLVRRNINVFGHQHKNGEGNDSVGSQTMKINVISPPERKYSIWIEGQLCFSFKLKHISLMNEKKMKKRLLLIVLVVNIQLCHTICNSMYFFIVFFLFSAFSFLWYFSNEWKLKTQNYHSQIEMLLMNWILSRQILRDDQKTTNQITFFKNRIF